MLVRNRLTGQLHDVPAQLLYGGPGLAGFGVLPLIPLIASALPMVGDLVKGLTGGARPPEPPPPPPPPPMVMPLPAPPPMVLEPAPLPPEPEPPPFGPPPFVRRANMPAPLPSDDGDFPVPRGAAAMPGGDPGDPRAAGARRYRRPPRRRRRRLLRRPLGFYAANDFFPW